MEEATCGAVKRTDLSRVAFLQGWLRSRGLHLDNLQRATVEKVLATGAKMGADVRAVLKARLANGYITSSKLQTGIAACDSDGRLRNQLVYCGAQRVDGQGEEFSRISFARIPCPGGR